MSVETCAFPLSRTVEKTSNYEGTHASRTSDTPKVLGKTHNDVTVETSVHNIHRVYYHNPSTL